MEKADLKSKAKIQIGSLLKTGFFHIFGASTINRVLAVILSFVLVRLLSKADYGVYAYAFNIVSFFVLFNGLGVTSAILQICSELYRDNAKEHAIYGYGYSMGCRIDIIVTVLIFLIGIFVPLQIAGSNLLLALYCVYPFATLLFELKTVRLRVLLMNQEFAFATNIQSFLLVALSIGGAFLFGSVGLVVGQVLSYLLAYGYLCARYPFHISSQEKLSSVDKRDFWRISIISSFNNGLSQALTLTGTFFIGSLLANDYMVANYQVATLIPYGLLFVPGAFMTYAYPYFARNNKDKEWTIRNYLKVTVGSLAIMGLIAGVFALIAPFIISLLFGDQYLDIVPAFRILLLGFFIAATFRQPAGNFLVTQRKLLTNTVIGIITIIANVLCSLILIPQFSMCGAAMTYVLTMGISAALYMICYIRTICKL